MPSPLHSKQTTVDGIHSAISYLYADAAARTAATGFVAEDVDKLAKQVDDNTVWLLVSISPITWVQIGGPAAIEAGASPPVTVTGAVMWWHTTLGLMLLYDTTRSKWLSTAVDDVIGGRAGTTPPGSYYRGSDSMVLDASTRGIPVPKGTLTSISWSRTDSGSATLEVLVNGVAVAELNSTAAGATRDDTVNADFLAGQMSFRNKTGLANTQNVQIVAQYRRRP